MKSEKEVTVASRETESGIDAQHLEAVGECRLSLRESSDFRIFRGAKDDYEDDYEIRLIGVGGATKESQSDRFLRRFRHSEATRTSALPSNCVSAREGLDALACTLLALSRFAVLAQFRFAPLFSAARFSGRYYT